MCVNSHSPKKATTWEGVGAPGRSCGFPRRPTRSRKAAGRTRAWWDSRARRRKRDRSAERASQPEGYGLAACLGRPPGVARIQHSMEADWLSPHQRFSSVSTLHRQLGCSGG